MGIEWEPFGEGHAWRAHVASLRVDLWHGEVWLLAGLPRGRCRLQAENLGAAQAEAEGLIREWIAESVAAVGGQVVWPGEVAQSGGERDLRGAARLVEWMEKDPMPEARAAARPARQVLAEMQEWWKLYGTWDAQAVEIPNAELPEPQWDDAAIDAFNQHQHGPYHPLTCPDAHGNDAERTLIGTPWGMACPTCSYRQMWQEGVPKDTPIDEYRAQAAAVPWDANPFPWLRKDGSTPK